MDVVPADRVAEGTKGGLPSREPPQEGDEAEDPLFVRKKVETREIGTQKHLDADPRRVRLYAGVTGEEVCFQAGGLLPWGGSIPVTFPCDLPVSKARSFLKRIVLRDRKKFKLYVLEQHYFYFLTRFCLLFDERS